MRHASFRVDLAFGIVDEEAKIGGDLFVGQNLPFDHLKSIRCGHNFDGGKTMIGNIVDHQGMETQLEFECHNFYYKSDDL